MSILQAFYKVKSVTNIDTGKNREILESFRNCTLCTFKSNTYLISVCHCLYENTVCYIITKNNRIKIDTSQILFLPELDQNHSISRNLVNFFLETSNHLILN